MCIGLLLTIFKKKKLPVNCQNQKVSIEMDNSGIKNCDKRG